jgi:hypothetical protein
MLDTRYKSVSTECTRDSKETLNTSILYRVFLSKHINTRYNLCDDGGQMVSANYTECSVSETLGKYSLLNGWHTCFIYFTKCFCTLYRVSSTMVCVSKNGQPVQKRQSINEEASSCTKLLIVHTFEIDAPEDNYFCSSG